MDNQFWSWILTVVGLTGFILAGRKVWWSWYVNIACQGLWLTYAIVTGQYGFLAGAALYTVVFSQNAIRWTHNRKVIQKDYVAEHEQKLYEDLIAMGEALTLRDYQIDELTHRLEIYEPGLWLKE